ncbi:hypothetical protein BDN72DRAFT_850148 [Pluteus cervinus]|uniref:Uncharacterized protein n=1 Tax=Pluteus cervinus TaxID=181527 RepID=A0ACD3A6A4_9AGAR|nr:hypothetical protein BDN72DRAFT_850148 [Pluteus cervinus]
MVSAKTTPHMDVPGTSGTENVFQTIVSGRESWKTLRGPEVVWPPSWRRRCWEVRPHCPLPFPSLDLEKYRWLRAPVTGSDDHRQ